MGRRYSHGQLTEEQQKLVTDNLPFLWFYFKKNVKPKFKHLGYNVLDELMAEMQFYFCFAAEKYDPDKGKFSSYSVFYLRTAVKLYFTNITKLSKRNVSVVSFIDDVNVSTKKSQTVVWDDLIDLFDKVNIKKQTQDVLKLHYHYGMTMQNIAKKYKISKNAISKKIKRAINMLHIYVINNDIEMIDFIELFDIEENRANRKFSTYVLKEPVYT